MSKRNREKRVFTVKPAIMHTLHKDFQCTDEQIKLVMHALEGRIPVEVATHIYESTEDNYKIPEMKFALDMEDGTEPQHFEITNNPLSRLHHFLTEKYGLDFGHLYWTAIFLHSPQEFFKAIPMLKGQFNDHKEKQEAQA